MFCTKKTGRRKHSCVKTCVLCPVLHEEECADVSIRARRGAGQSQTPTGKYSGCLPYIGYTVIKIIIAQVVRRNGVLVCIAQSLAMEWSVSMDRL